ncbi:MAG: 30S ribosomal protein S6 [Phycisphaerales bacterium]|nr:30S ribosomal protein S6 [Phycisphaerales bacterium]MCI0630879.1 30S ribosomal protein S6 [Phycisphaerales bacterium]MCI0676178.1 30S ribosomal protein S6 [Phycisphaerales bacterium]
MPHDRTYKYEGLFLFPQSAVSDLQAAADHVLEILNRAGAKVISFKKWEERRLAYEIRGNKRGLYFLAYFQAPGGKLAQVERDCNLSEKLLRAMITRADHVTPETMQAAEGRAQLADEIKLRATQPALVEKELAVQTAAPEVVDEVEEEFLLDE